MATSNDQRPVDDQENRESKDDQTYRVLLCDRKKWIGATLGAFKEKVSFVVEVFCSEEEYSYAPILARMDRQFRSFDIYGRRYLDHVELFADQDGLISQCLQEQFEAQGCEITIGSWPDCWDESLPVLLNNAVMAEVVARHNKDLEWAVITHMHGYESLTVVSCQEAVYREILRNVRQVEHGTALRLTEEVLILALVRKNHVVWSCRSEVFSDLLPSIAETRRIRLGTTAMVAGQSSFVWTVPLVVPAAVKELHEKTSKQVRARSRKKAKLFRDRQEHLNIMDEETLDWLILPVKRRISREELCQTKQYIKACATAGDTREYA